jgi:hypothetical protein
MRILVGGKDRTADLGAELEAAARRRRDLGLVSLLEQEKAILSLKSRGNSGEYLDRHIELLRSRHGVDAGRWRPAGGRGAGGRLLAAVRSMLWKVMRPSVDWLTFRQNAVNAQLGYELEFLRDECRARAGELERRLSALEDVGNETAGGDGEPSS